MLILIAAMQTVWAQETVQVLTVNEAVQIALDNNLSLQQSALNVEIGRRNANRAWNPLIPAVSAAAMVTHPTSITGLEPVRIPNPAGGPPIEMENTWTPGFQISAGFNLSTATIENIRLAQINYEAGLLTHEMARLELELHVRRLFYQILLIEANVQLAEQNFASAQLRYEQASVLARTGQITQLDELSARVDMENTRPTVRSVQTAHENAMDAFKMILGIPTETTLRLDGSLSIEINRDFSPERNSPSQSLEVARLVNSIHSMEAQRSVIRNSVFVPSLRLAWASTPVFANTPAGRSWNDSGSFTVSLGMSLDSFLPWSNAKTQIDNINDGIRASQIQLNDTIRNKENRISQNIRTIEGILESLEAMKLNVELAQSTYEMIGDAFARGAVDFQRLRGAGDSLAMAQNRLLQEQFNLASALLDLERELNIPFGTLFLNQGE